MEKSDNWNNSQKVLKRLPRFIIVYVFFSIYKSNREKAFREKVCCFSGKVVFEQARKKEGVCNINAAIYTIAAWLPTTTTPDNFLFYYI